MQDDATLDEVLRLVSRLPVMDKLRLIERLAPQIEQDLHSDRPIPRQSLWGLCADLGPAPSANDIAQARREEWDQLPRGDIE